VQPLLVGVHALSCRLDVDVNCGDSTRRPQAADRNMPARARTPRTDDPESRAYSITELAREFDITPRAIRFYEDQGILAPVRSGSSGLTRVYSPRDRTRLKLTLRGKRLGLSLSQVRELIDMYESPKDATAQAKRFLNVLSQHRAALEQQREDIQVTLAEISQHETECQRILAQAKKR